jgi:hypothetical protein
VAEEHSAEKISRLERENEVLKKEIERLRQLLEEALRAAKAIVNAMGPIRQLVETDAKAQRRYLVIAPLNGAEPGAPVQVQVP